MADNELTININAEVSGFERSLNSIQGKLKTVAKVSGAAFAGLSAGIGFTVKQFADFDNQLRGVRTLLDESSFASQGVEEGFAGMRRELAGVASEFPVSIDSLNKALFDTVSAGVNANDAVGAVGTAAKLAVAGITDVSIATDGITSALNAYGISADQADQVAAKFFTAQKFGKTTVEELSGSFGLVASTAAASGVSFEELLAAVSAATTGGIRTNQAFTSLNAIIANVSKPTESAAAEAQRLGIEFNSTALRAKGLSGFLNDLTKAEGFNETSAEKLFGSVEALKVAYALTGAQADEFTNILGELQNETKLTQTFQEAFEIQNESLSNQFEVLKNQALVFAIAIGEQLAPVISAVVERIIQFTSFLSQNEQAAKTVAIALGVGAAGTGLVFAISSVGLALPAIISGLGAFKTALLGATIGVRALVGATGLGLIILAIPFIIKNLDSLINFFTGPLFAAFAFVQEIVEGVLNKFLSAFKAIKLAVTGNLKEATAEAKLALTPLPVIFFNASKAAVDAFDEGQKLGLQQEEKRISERLTLEKKGFDTQVKEAQKNADANVMVVEQKNLKTIDLETIKAATLINEEQNLANSLIEIDTDLANSQIDIFNDATSSLVSAARSRRSALEGIEQTGAGEATAGQRVGPREVVITDPRVKELFDNPERFVFGPKGFQRRVGFQEGFSGEGLQATFSGREIVIPENFAEGIRAGRFALVSSEAGGGQRVSVDINFKGQAAQILTAKQNENRALGTSREF